MNRKIFDISEFVLLLGIIFFLNIIFSDHFFRIDLTEDERYTIAPVTKDILGNLNDVLFIEVYLEGELSPDYTRLQKAIREKLNELRLYSGGKIEYKFTDPNAIENKQVREQFFAQLIQKGIQYRYERIDEGGKVEEKLIFPSALISYHGKETAVSFMKGSKILPLDQQLNQAVEGIEYEMASSIRKLNSQVVKSLAFIEGHGEFSVENLADISSALSEFYNVARIKLTDSMNLAQYKTLILAGPVTAFQENEKFLLDQYVVNGGNLLVLADALNLNADSLMNGYTYAFPYNTGLDDLLFKFGVRLNVDLIEDLNCALIKVATGNNDQTETVNWPFYPILYNFGKHIIVKNLDALIAHYIGSIDTVKASGITKTPLIFTTANTKIIHAPAKLDLNETRKNTDPASFNKGIFCVSYLLEGSFESLYKNRPSPVKGAAVVTKNKTARIIVCSDSDLIKNETDRTGKKPLPLGYDPTIRYEFANKDFLLHAVDFLMEEEIVNVRNKEIALRPLDKIRVNEDKLFWQTINLTVPAILILLFGIVRHILRKRKYELMNGK
jgi:ABC-2 type transport system permease protein